MQHFPEPEAVFRYFSALAAIPHGSGNTAQIRRWALDTADRLHLDASADAAGNVIIRKAASPGYETHPRVILQGHMDMVCAKLPDCPKDLETEGLALIWGEEFLSADGTTLGGDDGIALAYCFALLEADDIPHPPLTVIFTVDEETGMEGASALSPEALCGTYLINLDSEDEGIFTVGCAGGVRVHLCFPAAAEPAAGTCLRLMLSGLTGGHSGIEIHKPLLNANTLMLRLLREIPQNFRLCALEGGVRDNVIPTECTAALLLSEQDVQAAAESLTKALLQVQQEYPNETNIRLETFKESGYEAPAAADTAALLEQLSQLPNGVQAMHDILQMPQTSLNLGIFRLRTDTNEMHVDALIRSGVDTEKAALAHSLRQMAESAGGSAAESGNYPAWEYQPGTVLELEAERVFRELYGTAPVIETIHAGLECGILMHTAKRGGTHLQCLSIGPDLLDIHTPRERLNLASARRTWEFLLALLKAL